MELVWFMTIPGLICVLVVLAAIDRFTSWMSTASWLPWQRRRSGPRTVSSVAFDELEACFYAGKRHLIEQRRIEDALPDDDSEGAPPRPVTLQPEALILRLPVVDV